MKTCFFRMKTSFFIFIIKSMSKNNVSIMMKLSIKNVYFLKYVQIKFLIKSAFSENKKSNLIIEQNEFNLNWSWFSSSLIDNGFSTLKKIDRENLITNRTIKLVVEKFEESGTLHYNFLKQNFSTFWLPKLEYHFFENWNDGEYKRLENNIKDKDLEWVLRVFWLEKNYWKLKASHSKYFFNNWSPPGKKH